MYYIEWTLSAVADPEGDPRMHAMVMDSPFQAEHCMQKQDSQQLTEVQQSLPASTPVLSVQSSYKQSIENLNLQACCMQRLVRLASPSALHKKWACRCPSRCGSNFSCALCVHFLVWLLPFRNSRSVTGPYIIWLPKSMSQVLIDLPAESA